MRYLAPIALTFLVGSTAHAALPHEGLMLRGGAGFGFDLLGDQGEGDVTVTISGLSLAVNAAIGGYVARNFAINADVWYSLMPSPTVTISDDEGNELSGDADGDLSFLGLGAGVTYWVGNIDLFLAGTVGIGKGTASFEDDGVESSSSSDWSPVVKFAVGKQWAAGEAFGIGVGGDLVIGSLSEDDDSALWVASHVYFSVTLN